MNLKVIGILSLSVIILIVLAFLGGYFLAPKPIEYIDKPYPVEKVKYDTIEKEIKLGTTIINKKSDTTIINNFSEPILTKPFIASIDTITANDTFNIKYAYPQDSFYIRILPKPIVYKEVSKTEYLVRVIEIKRPLYIDVLSHLGAVAIGGGIGYFLGK